VQFAGQSNHRPEVRAIRWSVQLYGVAKWGHLKGLEAKVREFLARVAIMPWTRDVGEVYADLRANCVAAGVTLAPMDMMIAAHAKALDQASESSRTTILVTRDRVFSRIPGGIKLEDWTT
jgi:tRNA(fMet)-specific endonuclease VapC